ncbi:MAG: hydrogenase expression/formation C-terminal domain-containing protein [Thiogranum sp.]
MTAHGTPDTSPGCASGTACNVPTGNLVPLLHEIRHALERWLDSGEEHAIDLRGIPMAPGEEDRLLETLGSGEVHAELSLTSRSVVLETRFPAVWLVTHYNADDAITGRVIEICAMPAIMQSQTEDARAGLEYLGNLLNKDNLQ